MCKSISPSLLGRLLLVAAVPAGLLLSAVAAPGQQAGKAVPLFNGKDLAGWSQPLDNNSEWKVAGGILEGRGGGGGKPAVLVTQRQDFRNFTLTVRFSFKEPGYGGIELRRSGGGNARSCYCVSTSINPEEPEERPAGNITRLKDHEYGEEFPTARESKTVTTAVNRWHSLTITVVGNRVTTAVNGVKADEYDDPRSGFRSGAIALLVNGESACRFQAVDIQELPE